MTQELPEGTVTVLFTDVVGSTNLTTSRGDEAAQEILRAQRDLTRQKVEEHSGHEVKGLGDGFMVAFASARRAVACAVGIQRALEDHNRGQPLDEQVQVRIGLNTGEVIQEEADLFGETVNAAARIAAKAKGRQILVSEMVKGLLGRAKDVGLVDHGRFRLKGFPERWRLFEVVWQEETAAAPAHVERTPFVGREAERAELRRCLDQVASGRGALVMIGGEPGVGKTRLAEEMAAEARQRNMTALIGRCYEMEGAPPYIPFVEILQATARLVHPEALREILGDSAPEVAKLMPELRRIFPDIPAPLELPPAQERFYLFNSVREFVERAGRRQPLVLTMEDLHWADDSTLLLLQHIAQRLSEMPILIIGTYRDVELDVARPLARVLEELHRQRFAHRLSLKRLPEAGVSAMLRALSGQEPPKPLVDAVFSETEGNPFFVEEVFRHLAEEGKLFDTQGRWRSDLQVSELDVPEGVRLVIGRRLERVGEECRRVLTTAAVIGRDFSFELLEALGEADTDMLLDAVDEAERAHLIAAAEDGPEARFSFAHELIRQTLVSGVSLPRRQRLHLRVALAMERLYARNLEPHLGTVAAHFRLAGAATDVEKAIDYSLRAGEATRTLFAYEEAAAHWQAALELMEESGAEPERCAGLLERLGDLMHVTSLDYRVGVDYLERALRVYEELGQAERAAQVHSLLGRHLSSYYDAMDMERALAHYRAAEAVLGQGPESVALGDLYVGMAAAAWWAVHTQEGLTASRRAMEIGERLGNEAIWAHAAALHGWHLFAGGRLAEGLALAERAWETADRLDDPAVAVAAAYIRGFFSYHAGDPRDLQSWCQRELAKPRLAQAPVQRRRLLCLLAWGHIFAGELAEASSLLADLAPDIPPEEGWVEGGVASADGDWERAAALLAQDVQLRHRTGDRYAGSDSAHLLARVQRVRGEHQQAEALLQEALVEGQHLLDMQARLELALLYAEMGRPKEAEPHLQRCRETLAQGENWRGLAGRIALAEGALAATEGWLQDAEPLFEKAIETFRRYTLPWDEAEAQHLWGRALLRAGDRGRAVEKLDAAIEIYRRHGAGRPWIGRVEADKLRI